MHTPQYVVVGHITHDRQPDGSFLVGGTVAFASVTAIRLGVRAAIVTAAPPEMQLPEDLFKIEIHFQPSRAISTFRNEYRNGRRKQYLEQVALPINSSDVPERWLSAPFVHLAPLTQEVPYDLALRFRHSRLLVTPQGWMRAWDQNGLVAMIPWHHEPSLLSSLTAVVASIEDIRGNWAMPRAWAKHAPVVVITHGETGCTVMCGGEERLIPPREARVVDPTGAGDVFAAAFHIRYGETGDPWQAARFANVTASMSIEAPGLSGIPTRQAVNAYLMTHGKRS